MMACHEPERHDGERAGFQTVHFRCNLKSIRACRRCSPQAGGGQGGECGDRARLAALSKQRKADLSAGPGDMESLKAALVSSK